MQSKSSTQSLIEMRDVVKVYATAAGEFNALKGIRTTLAWVALWLFVIALNSCDVITELKRLK